jgi:multidrug efflux pump subunit AcrB
LIIFIFWPILWGIFKARLLPKSDQNQVYLWIDAPRWWNTQKMRWVVKEVNNFFINTNNQIPEHLKIVDNLSITVWQSFMWDFANLFRWGLSRVWQNQLSARINLISKDKYKDKYNEKRIISENYTIQIRQYFREYILKKYPDLKIQLLEDPAWPPTRATFLAKIKTNANETNRDQFFKKVQQEIYKIKSKQKLVDIGDSISTTYRKINIKIDNELISKSGLTVEQVILALKIWVSSIDIFTLKNNNSLENTNLVLAINSNQNSDLSLLKKIFVINKNNEKIYLDSIAKIEYSFVDNEINSDNKQEVDYIFWEMWDNSLTYPILKLFWIFKSKDFLWNEYIIKSSSPYSIEYMWLRDQKQYIIEWWWEWELQVDTFKDLWLAMWLSLLAIYFLLVWQFASFWIAWIIMTTFLLSFYWIFPGFTILFLIQNEYFSATSMIWIIALWWIVVWNAIILIDYLTTLKKNWLTIEDALLKAWYVRFAPIILTSLTTVFWALTITNDPVWSWLAWSIIWWLLVSSILTLIIIPIMYYDSQKNNWK